MAAQTPEVQRRSTRLEAKASSSIERTEALRRRRKRKVKRQQWSDEDSADELFEGSNDGNSGTDSDNEVQNMPVKTMRAKNNFTKVYSSYNFDRGGDYYEDDFIDDTEYTRSLKLSAAKAKQKEMERNLRKNRKHIKRSVVCDNSDNSESEGAKGEGPSTVAAKGKKRLFESSSSETDEEKKGGHGRGSCERVKKRRKTRWSDEDEIDHTPSRSSTRAKKLKREKAMETDRLLKKLKQARSKKGINGENTDSVLESSAESDDETLVGVSHCDNDHTPFIVDSSDSNDSEEDCEWIIPDEEGMEDEGEKKESNVINIDAEIPSIMAMESITTVLREKVGRDSNRGTNKLIMAAGKADLALFKRNLTKKVCLSSVVTTLEDNNISLLHLIIAAPWYGNENEECVNRNESTSVNKSPNGNESQNGNLSVINGHNLDTDCTDFLSYLSKNSSKTFKELVTVGGFSSCCPNILELAVWNNRPKTTEFLLSYIKRINFNWKKQHLPFDYPIPLTWPPSLFHVALYRLMLAEDSAHFDYLDMINTLLEFLDEEDICQRDDHGNTPLMYAAQMNYCGVLSTLCGYSKTLLRITDSEGHSPLHLAAASGCVSCVEALLSSGHEVDCRDLKGWPPLLYAHFSNRTDCFLALMKAKPKQLSVLSDMLRNLDEDVNKRMTMKVVRDLLISLAHTEQYYNQFNEFISDNLDLLDEQSFGFMKHCMSLLSFRNKQRWLRGKLESMKKSSTEWLYSNGIVLSSLPRDRLLQRVLELLWDEGERMATRFWVQPISVSFAGEAGICTGPRKEFLSILSQELGKGAERLFEQCDNSLLSLQPCQIFSNHTHPPYPTPAQVSLHLRKVRIVGSILAAVVFHGDNVDFNLTIPLTKQLLGQQVSPLEDLKNIDESFYNQLIDLQEQDGAEHLDLPFAVTLSSPWAGPADDDRVFEERGGASVIDVPLTLKGNECLVTDSNKDEYVKKMAEFKVKTKIASEVSALQQGFWKVLPKRYLKLFTPNEFSLLLSGVSQIDTEEWKTYTNYSNMSGSSDIVNWFWNLVSDLSQQEKGLLLKFTTGSPRLPPGGFKSLTGLGGQVYQFTLSLGEGCDKIPQARTCFNLLILSKYSSEQQLRNKVLIALRYGCEGFEFS